MISRSGRRAGGRWAWSAVVGGVVATVGVPWAAGAEFQVDVGEGDRIRTAGIGLATVGRPSPCGRSCDASAVLSGRVARWSLPYESTPEHGLWNASVLPALRIVSPFNGRSIVVEAGVGVHYLSGRSLYHRQFGSNWQFGERFAVGTIGAGDNRIGWMVWLEHVSNGGFATSNSGVTFFGAGVQIPLPP